MRKFTKTEKINGEYACRNLSEKASIIYETSSPLDVYEVNDKYYVRGIFNDDNLTFTELNDLLEDFAAEVML